ncbi:hypothetical protein ACVIYL_004374 [Bradyrhizobium sp. USDA 3315]
MLIVAKRVSDRQGLFRYGIDFVYHGGGRITAGPYSA